ncbi:hypothetical protein GCM10023185_09390 [Hymenobacter saemangeumensis]|uniref:Response regulator transcription factor n=1 Tax=Hymenobacter saemangeumensis TaxID=1084522 RepID=A0ABP8I4J6_9BACT
MSKIQILIVEDERLYGDLLCEYLEELGHEPLGPVPTAAQAVALFEALKPDLVLLDIGLRGPVDGVELARQLSSRQPVPLIFITAFTDRPTFERARAVGALAFITKPFSQHTVQNAVELALLNFARQAASSPESEPLTRPPAWEQDVLVRDAFFLKDREGLVKVPYSEALYIEAGEKYCVLVLASGHRYPLRMSLRDAARGLAGQDFVQVHRAYVINARHLEGLDPVGYTVQVAGRTLPLGRSHKDELLRRLNLIDGQGG